MIGTDEVLTPMLKTDVKFKISTCPTSPIFRKVNLTRTRSENKQDQISDHREIINHQNQPIQRKNKDLDVLDDTLRMNYKLLGGS